MTQSFIGSVLRHKQMIVIEGRYCVHADTGFRQSTGDCRQKADRFERGMNGQRDQSRCKLIGEPCSFGFLAPYDESRSFAFAEDVYRLECGWNFLVFRNAAKNENAFVQLGRHISQQRLQIAFARHGRMLFQQVSRISHRPHDCASDGSSGLRLPGYQPTTTSLIWMTGDWSV